MINNSQRSLRALTMLAAALVVFAALPGRTAKEPVPEICTGR
jgi:hypothetical protein